MTEENIIDIADVIETYTSSVRDVIFLLLLLSLMRGAERKSLKGERERARGEVAGFRNSESAALSQQDFGFSLCAVPEFQV